MATLQNFDAEIEKTKQVVEEMRTKIEQSGTMLDKFAQADQKIGEADFDIENARIQDVLRQVESHSSACGVSLSAMSITEGALLLSSSTCTYRRDASSSAATIGR